MSTDERHRPVPAGHARSEAGRRLCEEVLELPDAAVDHRFRTNRLRQKHRRSVERLVATAIRRLVREDLEQRLDAAGVPWGRLNPPGAVVDHPQLAARSRWINAGLPGGAHAQVLRSPFSAVAEPDGRTVPGLGTATVDVLRWLGYADTEIEDLRQAGVVGY